MKFNKFFLLMALWLMRYRCVFGLSYWTSFCFVTKTTSCFLNILLCIFNLWMFNFSLKMSHKNIYIIVESINLINTHWIVNGIDNFNVFKFTKIKWWLMMWSSCKQCYNPPVTSVTITPVMLVLRTAPKNQINCTQKDTKNGTGCDCNVKCSVITVNWFFKKGIVQICCALFNS